jgi:hypothetical protein
MGAADTRQKICSALEESKPLWTQVHEHSRKVAALSVEYHRESLKEALGVEMEDGLLVATLDIRQKPVSLDATISQIKMSGAKGLRAFHNLEDGKIYVFKSA